MADSAAKQEEKYTFLDPQTEQIAVLREKLASARAEHTLILYKREDELHKEYSRAIADVQRQPWSRRAMHAIMRALTVVVHLAWFFGSVALGAVPPCLVVMHRLPPRDSYFIIPGGIMLIAQYIMLRLEDAK